MAKKTGKIGLVVSTKMQKTAVVKIEVKKPHPLYEKLVKKSKKFKAHSEIKELAVGDLVRIVSVRPISKEKKWKVAEVVKHAPTS